MNNDNDLLVLLSRRGDFDLFRVDEVPGLVIVVLHDFHSVFADVAVSL